jgi:hypothetical protein
MYYSLRLMLIYAGTLDYNGNAEVRYVSSRDVPNGRQLHSPCASIL